MSLAVSSPGNFVAHWLRFLLLWQPTREGLHHFHLAPGRFHGCFQSPTGLKVGWSWRCRDVSFIVQNPKLKHFPGKMMQLPWSSVYQFTRMPEDMWKFGYPAILGRFLLRKASWFSLPSLLFNGNILWIWIMCLDPLYDDPIPIPSPRPPHQHLPATIVATSPAEPTLLLLGAGGRNFHMKPPFCVEEATLSYPTIYIYQLLEYNYYVLYRSNSYLFLLHQLF